MSQISGPATIGPGSGTITSITFNGGLTSTPTDPITTAGTATLDQSALTVADGTVYWTGSGATGKLNTTAVGTSGWVLTSQGAAMPPVYAAISGTFANSFVTDSGTATPSSGVLNIIAGVSTQNAGSSVEFTGSGNTVELNVTDSNFNTIIGINSGNSSLSGQANIGLGIGCFPALTSGGNNVAIGADSLHALTSGTNNTAIGKQSIEHLTAGNNNIAIGLFSGEFYTGGESNNIVIGNTGVISESGVTRIGTSGTQTSAYIAGIAGVNLSTATVATIATGTGQLGSAAITAGSGISISTATANEIIISTSGTTGNSVLFLGNQPLSSVTNTSYFGPGQYNPQTTTALANMAMPVAGTLSDLYVYVGSINTSTTNVTVTLYQNGSATSLKATITALTTGTFTDTSHSVSVSAGDLICWQVQESTTGGPIGSISMKLTA